MQIGPDIQLTLNNIQRDQYGRRSATVALVIDNVHSRLTTHSHKTVKIAPDIFIVLFNFSRRTARIGIDAPQSVRIARFELLNNGDAFNNDFPRRQ